MQNRIEKLVNRAAWGIIGLASSSPANLESKVSRLYPTTNKSGGTVYETRLSGSIEPDWGFVISDRGCLFEDSLAQSYPSPWRFGTPSPWVWLKAQRNKSADNRSYESVVSLRHLWEWNYFHFYVDVLGKLALLDEVGVPDDIPLVLGAYANQVPFVKQIISIGKLKNRHWVIQDGEYVHAKNIIYCDTKQDAGSRLSYVLRHMDLLPGSQIGNDRIYLTRRRKAEFGASNRFVVNDDDVVILLSKYGFRVVDTASMTVADQIKSFAAARYVIGVHGAGLINMLFRKGGSLDVIELHSSSYLPLCFKEIAHSYGFGWNHVAGDPEKGNPQHANFTIPLDQLEVTVRDMLASDNA